MNTPNDMTASLIEKYIKDYSEKGAPIGVNFRELIPSINKAERYTHLIHKYPAKLLCHIPYFFLNSEVFCPDGGVVVDPFCGTGTVLLEAVLANKNAYGADANPLARLISSVKVNYIEAGKLLKTLKTIIDKARSGKYIKTTVLENVNYWFSENTIMQLSEICGAIHTVRNKEHRAFFEVCFSNLIKKVSYADPRISVPVKLNPERFINDSITHKKITEKVSALKNISVYDKFEDLCNDNITRLSTLKDVIKSNSKSSVISCDARNLTSSIDSNEKLEDQSVDLILTSPPYAGAQKYIRSSSLNLGWLGLANAEQLRVLDSKNIGRENYRKADFIKIETGIEPVDSLLKQLCDNGKYERAHIVGKYIEEMKAAIDESIRVLKEGGYFIMIIGNNMVCGLEFNTQEYLTEYMINKGLQLQFKLIDDIKSYGLMTKRNKTANRISCEWVLVLKKQHNE